MKVKDIIDVFQGRQMVCIYDDSTRSFVFEGFKDREGFDPSEYWECDVIKIFIAADSALVVNIVLE